MNDNAHPENDPKIREALARLQQRVKDAQGRKCVFLLVGRTGVGKSSTVNSLLGTNVAPVGDYEPTTVSVEKYEAEFGGFQFTVVDTPGLCDDLPEAGNDDKYISLMREGAPSIDTMWFVTPLTDPRVRQDEVRAIKLITDAFTKNAWEHAVIVFTFAGNVQPADRYPEALQKRTELIRREIARFTGETIAAQVPAVPVENSAETTPDGKNWKAELYTQVVARISNEAILTWVSGTAHLTTGHAPHIALSDSNRDVIRSRISESVGLGAITGASGGAVVGLFMGGPIGAAVGAAVGGTAGAVAGFFRGLFGR